MSEKTSLEQIKETVGKVITAYGGKSDEYTEVEKQVLSAVSFGAANALAFDTGDITPAMLAGSLPGIYEEFLPYSRDDAEVVVAFLINCTNPDYHPTFNMLIQKGIDAYFVLDDTAMLKENLDKIVEIVKENMDVNE